MATAAVFALFASLAVYIVVSIRDARRVTTTAGFFHDAGRPWRAIISLTAFSITLGTGLVYVLAQARTTGWLIFLTPAGVLLGYWAIARFYRSLAYKADARAPNIFYLLAARDASGAYTLSAFGRFFGLFMALTYVLVLGFELKVGSEIIVDSLLAEPTPAAHIGFALLIYLVVVAYTALGGLRAAVSTDVFQIGFIVLFLGALCWLLMSAEPASVAASTQAAATDGTLAASSAALALIMAVTTQFYSIVNVNMGSGYDPQKQYQIFWWVGIASGAVYAGVALLGLYLGAPEGLSRLIQAFVGSGATDLLSVLIVASLFAGMLAVLMSTLDNMTISVTQIVSENLFSLNPFKKPANSIADEQEAAEKSALWKLRIAHSLVSFSVLAFMLICVHVFDDPFPLLLTILFAATIMSPLTAAAVWITAHGGRSILHRPWVAWLIFAGTMAAWSWYFMMTVRQARQESVWLHLAAFAIAFLIAMLDLVQAGRRSGSGEVIRGGVNGRAEAFPEKVV